MKYKCFRSIPVFYAATMLLWVCTVVAVGQGLDPASEGYGYGRNSLAAGVAVDRAGNVYVADPNPSQIRRITPAGVVTIVAGTGDLGYAGDGGPATSAQFRTPTNLAVDQAGNVYVGDSGNFRIRKISTTGIVSTVAGNGKRGFSGDDGPAIEASLNGARVKARADGVLYISETVNQRIRKVGLDGVITTIAGDGTRTFGGDGRLARLAQLDTPYIGAVDAAGNVFFASSLNSRIRKVTPSAIISTIAGSGVRGFGGDGGPAISAQLGNAIDMAADESGNLYIADMRNNRIRKINSSGIISTVAGTGVPGSAGDGSSATAAQLNRPSGVAIDSTGNIFIADFGSYKVRKVNSAGIISTPVGQ